MGKSRIFAVGLGLFLLGSALAEFLLIPPAVGLTAMVMLLGLLLIFDEAPIKVLSFWAVLFIFGLFYPEFLGRDKLVSIDSNNPVVTWFVSERQSFLSGLARLLGQPFAALSQGLTLGERSEFSRELKQAFIATGTIHIVAVSGYNFTIIIKIFADTLRRWIGPKWSFYIGTLTIFAFVLLVGNNAPVVRAAIMGWLFFLAAGIGRLPNVSVALLVAAAAMTVFEPKIIVDSLSFQLSMLSMAGLILITPRLEKLFDGFIWRSFTPAIVRSSLAATLGAQAATLGLILAVFGRASFVAPLVNVLIAPLVPLATIVSLLLGGAAIAWSGLPTFFAYPAWLLLAPIIAIIEFFGRFSFASFRFNPWPWWWAVGYYIILAIMIWMSHSSKQSLTTSSNAKLKTKN